jgi:hypothetical protein
MECTAFGPDIWIVDGPPVNVAGPLKLPTRMIVVRLRDGSLWIDSPVSVSQDDMEKLTVLGPVGHLVSPAKLHTWRIASWAAAFPDAQRWTPPEILRDEVPQAWAADLDQAVFRGNAFAQEVEFLHPKSRTLIFNDFIQNYSPQPRRPLLDMLLKLSDARDGGVPTDIKLSFTNKELARRSLRKLLSWDFDNLILAHGDCIRGGAKAFVEGAFRFLRLTSGGARR